MVNWGWFSSVAQAWVVVLSVGVVLHVWVAVCLYLIARKVDIADAWFAWAPILNLILSCRAADKPAWWVLLFLIPLVNIVVYLDIWMTIAESRDQPSWLGLLMIVPLVNLIVLGVLAFTPKL